MIGYQPEPPENSDKVTLCGLGSDGLHPWSLEVILDPPTCAICDNRNHKVVAFILHSGQPVCEACVKKFGP